jgi:hypothetical protein
VVGDDPRWPGVLDALEADALRLAALDPDRDDVGSMYAPPPDLGPLPSWLRDRALAVVGALEAGSATLVERLDVIRAELGKVERSQRVGDLTRERRGSFEVHA